MYGFGDGHALQKCLVDQFLNGLLAAIIYF